MDTLRGLRRGIPADREGGREGMRCSLQRSLGLGRAGTLLDPTEKGSPPPLKAHYSEKQAGNSSMLTLGCHPSLHSARSFLMLLRRKLTT